MSIQAQSQSTRLVNTEEILNQLGMSRDIQFKDISSEDYGKTVNYLLDKVYKLIDEVHMLSSIIDQAMADYNLLRDKYLSLKQKFHNQREILNTQEDLLAKERQNQLEKHLRETRVQKNNISSVLNNQYPDCKFCLEKLENEKQLRNKIQNLENIISFMKSENAKLSGEKQLQKLQPVIINQPHSPQKIILNDNSRKSLVAQSPYQPQIQTIQQSPISQNHLMMHSVMQGPTQPRLIDNTTKSQRFYPEKIIDDPNKRVSIINNSPGRISQIQQQVQSPPQQQQQPVSSRPAMRMVQSTMIKPPVGINQQLPQTQVQNLSVTQRLVKN